VATHVLDGDPGSPWVVGGTYRLVLRRDGERWRIVELKLDTRWQTGDSGMLERAASR
jgi:SnoaL-like domain